MKACDVHNILENIEDIKICSYSFDMHEFRAELEIDGLKYDKIEFLYSFDNCSVVYLLVKDTEIGYYSASMIRAIAYISNQLGKWGLTTNW